MRKTNHILSHQQNQGKARWKALIGIPDFSDGTPDFSDWDSQSPYENHGSARAKAAQLILDACRDEYES
jgi:hypothetical protein